MNRRNFIKTIGATSLGLLLPKEINAENINNKQYYNDNFTQDELKLINSVVTKLKELDISRFKNEDNYMMYALSNYFRKEWNYIFINKYNECSKDNEFPYEFYVERWGNGFCLRYCVYHPYKSFYGVDREISINIGKSNDILVRLYIAKYWVWNQWGGSDGSSCALGEYYTYFDLNTLETKYEYSDELYKKHGINCK